MTNRLYVAAQVRFEVIQILWRIGSVEGERIPRSVQALAGDRHEGQPFVV